MIDLRTLRALGAVDAAGVARDALLRWMLPLPLLLAVAARWLLPPLLGPIGAQVGIDLAHYYAPLMGYVLLATAPTICGMLVGFLLLDQRDDRTLLAMRVTPLPLAGYLAYRLALPMLLSLALTLLALPLSGLVRLGAGELLLVALAAAPLAPLNALFLGALAANKVQGFALQKALGVVMLAPAIGALAPQPWGLLAAAAPTYWPAALLWGLQAGLPLAWLLLPAGLLYQGLLVALLLRRLQVL